MSRARAWAVLLAAVATGAGLLALMSPASAASEGVCEGVHVEPAAGATSVTITAPAGYLISSVCVKAGSIQQGDGPEVTTYAPPVASVTVSHSTGKAISHYVATFVPIGTSTTPTTSGDDPDPTTTSTTAPTTTTTCPDCTPGTLVITTTTTAPGATSTTAPTSAPPAPPAPNPGPAPIAPAPVGGVPYTG